ncbi:extracellular solute-binding protein [Paenibacillus eucommiae]|uniref:ABC-type glycerol-3-phosphate transport system substrate-binding protein n=1 Tax=Paenibacillus eucommiae TaxID=1355755 RepID=A0ABS4IM13_9BACL|nr:extracellular solute-binding protein [Paenibacillus eucommiae]MBP1988608.1 ABC-type glycerol-3-phosphate transport system substrate-binding protein [Paenibacillus eucommiae]
MLKAIKRLALLLILCMLFTLSFSSLPRLYMEKENTPTVQTTVPVNGEVTYSVWRATIGAEMADASALSKPLVIPSSDYSALSDTAGFEDKGTEGLLWKDGESWIEYQVDVPEDGLYHLGLVYDSVHSNGMDISRGVQIDGVLPYKEARHVQLKRVYKHANFPPERDDFNNDIRPASVEVPGWKSELLSDFTADARPLKWLLTKGVHTIRLLGDRESIMLKELFVQAPIELPSYAEASAGYSQADANGDWIQIYEAEKVDTKSNTSLQLQSNNDALISPSTDGLVRYNAIGGDGFRFGGQWLEWEFEVPKDGRYQIGFKFLQKFLNNSYAFRTMTIDGDPLFQEMQTVRFPYDPSWKWQGLTLSDQTNQPLLFQLKAGKHHLRMTVNSAPIKPVYEGLLRNLSQISQLNQEIRRITGNYDKSSGSGGNVDLNRDWDLETYIPDLGQRLQMMIDDMNQLADELSGITTGRSDTENAFRSGAEDLEYLKKHIKQIPNRLNTFEAMQNNLAVWANVLLEQPLMLDYFWVAEPGADSPKIRANLWDSISKFTTDFSHSFTIDYEFRRKNPEAIDIWVNRGRDYANLIQQLADETFTPKTGIPVNVNIVPDAQMFILGNISGLQPDVALGVDGAMPIDFATRGALVDLSQFPDYKEVARQFHPGALRTFHYDSKDYALPETQGFNVMMYRSDILGSLGVEPPETWADLVKILPSLQQNGYNFFIQPGDYQTFIYQNGGELYAGNGLKSGLDSEAAYKGFQQWTDMFSLYQLPKEVPSFYSHFRLGDIPIGIIDFNTYLQISFAAPELVDRWKIVPIPGNKQEDGTIVRWSGGPLQAGVIFNKSDKQDESWTFLKWWTSAETQSQFGNDIEALNGPEFRWNTANLHAFTQLPWPREDLKTIMEQWKWYKEAPQVPGGYFTPRMMSFAWVNVTGGKLNPREEIESAVNDINREMARKQLEFGIIDNQGDVQHELDVPLVQQPWEGGKP